MPQAKYRFFKVLFLVFMKDDNGRCHRKERKNENGIVCLQGKNVYLPYEVQFFKFVHLIELFLFTIEIDMTIAKFSALIIMRNDKNIEKTR